MTFIVYRDEQDIAVPHELLEKLTKKDWERLWSCRPGRIRLEAGTVVVRMGLPPGVPMMLLQ